MALTIKSSDTAVAANAVIALQEHIEIGNKVSENIRNNIELFNQAAKLRIVLMEILKKK